MNGDYDIENNNNDYDHEDDDLDSLDLNILTPRETVHSQTGEEEDKVEEGGVSRQSLQGYHRDRSSRSSIASYKRGHIKSASQLSSGVVTVKGMATPTAITHHRPTASSSSTPSPPQSPSALSISSRRYSSSSSASRQYHQQQQQQGAEDMMYASPDYRKSLTMSLQSDVPPGADFSGRHSARGSSVYVSDQQQQRSNLLRDATWMIEQQHLQDNIDGHCSPSRNRVSHSSEESGTNTSASCDNGVNDGFGGRVVFEYYEGEWDWLPNFDEMRPDHVGIVGNFMIDDTTERDLFRPQVYTGAGGAGKEGTDGVITGAGFQPKRRRPYKESGNFAVRFTTHMDITQDGVYSFWLSSNDGSVLYISNTLVVENDGMHYTTEAEGRILLQAGRHPMTVEFFHRNGKMLEGFRSTGPSLVVSFRAPGPVWSFGLKAGPKRVVKSSNLFFDHGDIRLRNLLNEYGTDDDSSMTMMNRASGCLLPTESRRSYNGGFGFGFGGQDWHQQQQQQHQGRHRVMSADMGMGGGGGGQQMQLSTRELMVQMENAKTTIKDLEQGQVDRLVGGLKRATLFEKPKTRIHPSHNNNPAWRNTVVSIYVDAQEDYPVQGGGGGGNGEFEGKKIDVDESNSESAPEGDDVLEKHLSDLEKLKQLYFFSMALSVKMNREMMGKPTSEYTSTSVQKLYEDCALHSNIPVERWPGYVSRHFARRQQGDGAEVG
ncbi:hypothetical protein BGW39_000652, partial [Mortierella sp. 14UC]